MFIGVITLTGLILRLIFANQSFWLDEGASLMLAGLPLAGLIDAIKADFHPPLFYALLHFWLPIAGKSEIIIRLPFILLSVATIPALYSLCRQVFGDKSKVPYIASVFLALNPLHIYYSQELRMYSLATLFAVVSWLFLFKKKFFLSGIFNLFGLFTFYGFVFNILSQLIYLLFDKSNKKKKNFFYILAPSVILFFLWLPVFSDQLSNGEYLKSALPGWQVLSGALTIKSLALIPLKFILGRISFEPEKIYILTGGILTLTFLIIALNSVRDKKARAFWYAFLIPIILGTVISLKTPVLGYWRFLFILPFFLILVAAGIEDMPRIIFWGTVMWVCGIFLFSNLYFWNNQKFHREDWRGLAGYLSGKESQLLIAFPYKFAPLFFYETETVVVPLLDANYQRIQLSQNFETSKPVYYLDYLADITDPNRFALKSLGGLKLKQTGVYNFNNLGQLYEFQPL